MSKTVTMTDTETGKVVSLCDWDACDEMTKFMLGSGPVHATSPSGKVFRVEAIDNEDTDETQNPL